MKVFELFLNDLCTTTEDKLFLRQSLVAIVLSLYNQPGDFVFPSERLKGKKPLDLASVLKKKIQPAFKRIGITGEGWHTFRHTVGTMLAEMGEHQLMIRDYLRHSDLHVTNKYLQATTKANASRRGSSWMPFCQGAYCREANQP
jgi:integrase